MQSVFSCFGLVYLLAVAAAGMSFATKITLKKIKERKAENGSIDEIHFKNI